jgi:hypothetical protein
MKNKIVQIIVFIFSQYLNAQSNYFALSGKIVNEAGHSLPYASVRIAGTTIGTISDGDGKFKILLRNGAYTLHFSYVGHEPRLIPIDLVSDLSMRVELIQNSVTLPEVIVDGEDPAYPIMREAIHRKQKLRSAYSSFRANVYTKESFGRDTTLALLSEAYSTIYSNRGDTLKEIVVHRRQTANLLDIFQFAMVRSFINFYEDSVVESGYTFISPLADNAFKSYRYRLIASKQSGQRTLHEIEILPQTNTSPLFSGTIVVDDSAYLMVRAQLEPNEIFQLPFYKIHRYQITQQYGLYNDRYWMPLDYHIGGSYGIRLLWLGNDSIRVTYKKTVICYEYQFDHSINDSVSTLPSQSALRSDKSKSEEEWKAVSLFPLSDLEERTYKRIDSTARIKPPISPELVITMLRFDSLMRKYELRYNRVEGLFVGGKGRHYFTPAWRVTGTAGYGFSDSEIKYHISSEYAFDAERTVWLGAGSFRLLSHTPMNHEYSLWLNTFNAFFGAEDAYDYYRKTGNKLYMTIDISRQHSISYGIIRQLEQTTIKQTDFSVHGLSRDVHQRPNPPIDDGWNTAYFVEVQTQQLDPTRMFQPPSASYRLWAEYADQQLGSDRTYRVVHGTTSFRIYPMGQTRLFDPYIGIAISAGASGGDVPIQKTFAFEPPLSKIVTPSTLRTIRRNEFTGDQYIVMSLEPNFRNIPFLMLGLAHLPYDLLFRVTYGEIRNNVPSLTGRVFPLNGAYREYSFGVGRIMELFRFDATYSDYQGGRFALTLNSIL